MLRSQDREDFIESSGKAPCGCGHLMSYVLMPAGLAPGGEEMEVRAFPYFSPKAGPLHILGSLLEEWLRVSFPRNGLDTTLPGLSEGPQELAPASEYLPAAAFKEATGTGCIFPTPRLRSPGAGRACSSVQPFWPALCVPCSRHSRNRFKDGKWNVKPERNLRGHPIQ